MAWHSFLTNKYKRKERKKNFDENLEDLKGDLDG